MLLHYHRFIQIYQIEPKLLLYLKSVNVLCLHHFRQQIRILRNCVYTLGKVNGKFCYKGRKHSYKNDEASRSEMQDCYTLKKEEEGPLSYTELKNLR